MKDSWVFSNTERQSGLGFLFRQFLRGIFSKCFQIHDEFLFSFLKLDFGFRERGRGFKITLMIWLKASDYTF
jgi:hypothetical protein